MEETKRSEKSQQENARMHQQLPELLAALTPNSQAVNIPWVSIEGQQAARNKPSSSIPVTQHNAREKVLGIQAPIEKKQPLQRTPYRELGFPQFSGKNSKAWLENSAVKDVEQQHQEYLPRETDKKLEMRSGSSISQPKGSLKLHTAELPPPEAAYIVPTPSKVQPPPSKATYTVTSPRLEESNWEDNVVPSLIRANKGKEPRSETQTNLQIVANRKYEAKLKDSGSKLEGPPKLRTAQPPLLGPTDIAPNAHTPTTEVGSTPEVAENTTHSSKGGINDNFVETGTTNEKKMQELYSECREKYVTGHQCKNSSLHALQSHIEVDKVDELETTSEVEELEQEHHDYLQMEINRRPEGVLREGVSQQEEQLEPLTDQQAPLQTAHIVKTPSIECGNPVPAKSGGSITPLPLTGSKEFPLCKEEDSRRWLTRCKQHSGVNPKPQQQLLDMTTQQSARVVKTERQEVSNYKDKPPWKEIVADKWKKVDMVGLIEDLEGSCRQKHKGPVENTQAKIEDLRIQELIQNSSLVKASLVCILVNGYTELGATLEMPHPCSLSLAYEQDKMRESNREWDAALHTEERCKAPTDAALHTEERCKAPTDDMPKLSWCKQREQARSDLKEQLITKRQGVKYYTAGRRSERVFGGREQIYLEIVTHKHPSKPLRINQNLTFNHYGPHHTSEQTSWPAAHRLRLSEGPRSEPSPQQVSPSMPLAGKGKRLGARLENTSNRYVGKLVTNQRLENMLREATREKRMLLEKITQPSPILEDKDGFKGEGM